MASLLDIRRRIRSVKSTQQITRAMKMVAAARLRRAQDRIFNARPYANQMMALLSSVAARTAERCHPLLLERPIERQLLVLVTADRGLCGAFNTNLVRAAQSYLDEHRDRDISVMTVGRKGRDYFIRRPVKMVAEYINIFGRLEFSQAQPIAQRIIELYTQEKVDTVDYIYEQPAQEIFNALLPRYVEIEVYRALLESQAAELAAKMTAMDAATNNAKEMIDSLTLYMNRVRQAAITREIIEVVSGAAAT